MTRLRPHPGASTSLRVPTGSSKSTGVVAVFTHHPTFPDIGIKSFETRKLARARWREESLAGIAGLAPPVLSPVLPVVASGSTAVRYGYIVRRATPLRSRKGVRAQTDRIKRLARASGLVAPTDMVPKNLGEVDGVVVLIDWGSDNTRMVGWKGSR